MECLNLSIKAEGGMNWNKNMHTVDIWTSTSIVSPQGYDNKSNNAKF